MTVSFIGSSGCSGASINGGTVTATFATAPSAGDILLALGVLGSTRTGVGNVYSSNGTLYTQLSSLNISTSTLAQGAMWFRVAVAGETTVTCSGSGGSSDATALMAYVFRNVGTALLQDNVLRDANATG